MMSFLKFGDISVWCNKYEGVTRLHVKQGSQKGDKSKYINFNLKEVVGLGEAVNKVLQGDVEVEVRLRESADGRKIPVTLYGPTMAKPTFDLVLGGEKAGHETPLSKVSFATSEHMVELANFVVSCKNIMNMMDDCDLKNISKWTKEYYNRMIIKRSDKTTPDTALQKTEVRIPEFEKGDTSKNIEDAVKEHLRKILKDEY